MPQAPAGFVPDGFVADAQKPPAPYKSESVYLKSKGIGTEEPPSGALGKLNAALEPLAHPQSMSDMLPMLSLTGVPVGALASAAGSMTGKALQGVGKVVSQVGNSRAAPVVSGYAALNALEHGDLTSAALAVGVPKVVQLAGRGIQTLGDFLAPIIKAAPKMKISAGDFLKVRGLMDQGIDEATALKAVFAAKAGATRVP